MSMQEYRVINVNSGEVRKVLSFGPRDALYSVAGWGSISFVAGWVYSGEWKVRSTS